MAELPVPSEKTLDFENGKHDVSFLLVNTLYAHNVILVLACTLRLVSELRLIKICLQAFTECSMSNMCEHQV